MDEYYDVIEINDEVNSKEEIINAVDTGYLSIPANSNLQLTIYPHFNSISLEFLKSLCEIFTIDRIKIELYSYTNDFKDFRDVDGELRKKLTIFKYDISQIQDVLKKLLVCNATAGEESRFLFPYISLERELTQVQDPRKNSDVEFDKNSLFDYRKIAIGTFQKIIWIHHSDHHHHHNTNTNTNTTDKLGLC
ncbi:hypothetical protein JL09_g6098 [Pichia kudriavzevii]|uniref:Uncharacterized protein n=1 Tax=Pichia kudriavzevii TaxID=4909 RepID=A0A099NPM0_PICKU|nr:hypothetical protein JL09_g6098 [Pichia kudriavzevii]